MENQWRLLPPNGIGRIAQQFRVEGRKEGRKERRKDGRKEVMDNI